MRGGRLSGGELTVQDRIIAANMQAHDVLVVSIGVCGPSAAAAARRNMHSRIAAAAAAHRSMNSRIAAAAAGRAPLGAAVAPHAHYRARAGGNDIALRPTLGTICCMAGLVFLARDASIASGDAWGLGHFMRMFRCVQRGELLLLC